MLMEEDPVNYLLNVDDSAWGNDDCIVARHLASGGNPGFGNIAYTDTHVGRVQLLPRVWATKISAQYFRANSMCIRTRGKFISGRAWYESDYGYVNRARPASEFGVTHAR
jgi:hypothetical protein